MHSALVRRALQADIAPIDSLLDLVDELHVAQLPWLLRKPDAPRSPEFLDGFITAPDRVAFVAGGAILQGVILAYLRELREVPVVRPCRVAEIDTLIVHPSYRRRGVGRALVDASIAWSRAALASRVELGVYEFNEIARCFWESVGFGTLSRRLHRPLGDAS